MGKREGSYWVESGIYSFLLNITNSAFGFGVFYVLIRVFSKSDFGVWAIYLTITTMIETIRTGMIKNALIKFLNSNDESSRARIFSSSGVLNFIISIVFVGLLIVFGGALSSIWDSEILKDLLLVYCIYLLFIVPFSQIEFTLQAFGRFKEIFIIYFIRFFSLFILALFFYFDFVVPSMITLIYFQIGTMILGTLVGAFFFMKLPGQFFSSKLGYVSELFHFGKFVVGTNLSGLLNASIDQFMIGSIVSTASVAAYNASNRITTFINMPATVLASIVFPQSAKLNIQNHKERAKELYEKSLSANLAIIIPVILFALIFAEPLIVIIAGPQYLDATNVLRLMVIMSGFVPFARLFGTIMDSIGYQSLNFYVTSLSAVSNVILNFFLIREHGVMGALFGTLIVFILGFIAMQIYLRRILSVQLIGAFILIPSFYKRIYILILERTKRFLS